MRKKINIEGMSCGHCARHIEEALREINGVKAVKVDLDGKNAVVDISGEIADSVLREAVEEAGYDVTSIVDL